MLRKPLSWSSAPTAFDSAVALPVILGGGVTGMAISRALSGTGITHVLVCEPPGDTPRLGESLNPEGSLEAARQFPEFSRFFFDKRQVALFYGEHALSFDAIRTDAAAAWWPLLGYPGNVKLLHVDRIGFDRALFDSVTTDPHCLLVRDRVTSLDARPRADRIDGVQLASGRHLPSSYVFDATNHLRVVPRELGIGFQPIDEARSVVFAHYRRADDAVPAALPPWMQATSLLRLHARHDPIDGLAWCIPLGDYVSVGIGIDPAKASPNPVLLLDWVETAYAERGIRVREAFARRSAPVNLRYQHYSHERCYGRNWLLAGPTCCQVWFPSAAGVGSGLLAARLAPDLLRSPMQAGAVYQAYMDQVTRSHTRLEWLARDDPMALSGDGVRGRAQAMIGGNVKRLARYAGFEPAPAELGFGDALPRLFERDRLLANPLRVEAALPSAQATRLFAQAEDVDPWMDPLLELTLPAPPIQLPGPAAILALVDVLSGRRYAQDSADFVSADVQLRIDEFQLQGVAAWEAWVEFLRGTPRVSGLDLRPTGLAPLGDEWRLTARWVGLKAGAPMLSAPVEMFFTLQDERVASIRLRRAEFSFVIGESLLPRAAFASLLQRMSAPAVLEA